MKQLPLCAHCGVNRVKKTTNSYCSRRCAGLAKTYLHPKLCKQCGIEYKQVVSNANTEYCSVSCYKKAHTSISTCLHCKKQFEHKSYKQRKFCSFKCTGSFYAEKRSNRVESNCRYCGKKFTSPASQPQEHCSQSCLNKARKELKDVYRCPMCKSQFEALVSSNQIYCSHSCYSESLVRLESRICPQCQEKFDCKPSDPNTYCSRACLYESMKIPGSHAGYGSEWSQISESIRSRDKNTCQNCGMPENGRSHDVHHIRPLREFNGNLDAAHSPNNLITLCKTCHGLAESGQL